MPTEIPTSIPTATSAAPTSIPSTKEPAETGSVALTLATSNGGPVPNGAIVRVDDVCQSVGIAVSAAATGTTVTFSDLDPGTYDVTVTNASPYADATGDVTVIARETATITLTLVAQADPTVLPTEPGAATPIATTEVMLTEPSVPSNPSGQTARNGGPVVTGLPSTGSGQESSTAQLVILLAASGFVLLAGVAGRRRRLR